VKKILFFFLLISAGNFLFAQFNKEKEPALSHPLNSFPQKKIGGFVFQQFPETLYVYAVIVQFKQYNDPNTTGDGTFDLSNNYPDSVDAPPHDSTYFLNHLEFLKNYYYKVSKGKLIIKYRLLGNVRNLPNIMSDYSPRRTENMYRLGNLFYDAWTSVDSVVDFTGIDPARSAFIIFHAGAGRDINLTSQGIFEGQLDLPSIFLSNSTLKSIYGDTTRGYYTKEGVIIPSSCLLPEQEYRVIGTSFGSSFLELGINGITVASIGSNLGLPDLFDTRTGNTAIGRFGLMDGQSIFSFSGVFPPEPSAWEKQYLGWVNPIPVYSDGAYTTRAASLDLSGNSSVYKVFISAKEYFLVENRNRDAKKNGQKIYFVNNGIPDSTIPFTQDQDGFQNGDIWKLKKNIVDVDEYDWSLPGLINDTAANSGGILIWHIDENVIDANFASNTINTDINHRGVDLEEAKGSQDIGVVINTPFGQFIGDGTPYDYWFNGYHYVPANIYRNEFTPTSFPNSRSYSDINSRVCLTNFSTIDSSMTFNYQQCGTITSINKYPRFVGIDTSGNAQPIGIDFNLNGTDEVFINVKDSLYGFRDNGNPIRVDMPNGFLKDSVSSYEIGYLPFLFNNPSRFLSGVYQNKFNLLTFNIDSLTTAPTVIQVAANNILSVPTLYTNVFDPILINTYIYSGTVDGKIASLSTDSLRITYDSVSNKKIVELARGNNSMYSFLDDNYKYFALGKMNSQSSGVDTVIITKDNNILLNGKVIQNHLGITQINSSPVLADINNDGNQEIIFTADDKVFAINRSGVVIDNFPFSITGLSSIQSGCAVADLNGDGIYDVIFGTGDGRVYAYGADGKVLDGFPLLTGKVIRSTPAIINVSGNFGLVVYSTDGYLYGWKTPWSYNESKILWRNYLADKYHKNSNFTVSAVSVTGPCLPADKVYNWPNPVYGKTTNIRYFLNAAATGVKVRIMDLAGELVTTLNGPAVSGLDNEVVWDVSNVQSGIYIGVIELQGSSCSETPSIKIAVVK
jgi:hypothetical protein